MMSREEKAAWLRARAGLLTASRMADAMAFNKTGKPSADRTKYMMELLAERSVGGDESIRHFVSPAMEWGIAHEDDAKMAYEAQTGVLLTDPRTVREHGLFVHPEVEFFAASPDALIDHDGLAEVKCPTTAKFLEWRMAGVVPDEHKPQMLAQLLCCPGRSWVEFIAYDPRIKVRKHQLFIRRYTPDAEELAHVLAAAKQFLLETERAWDQLFDEAA